MDAKINIQKVNFEFSMENEETAFDLYSGWDSFCRSLFERVVEKVLAPYDRDDVHLCINKLDLDLGEIPKEEFYEKFPILLEERLEELMKKLSVEGSGVVKEISKKVLLFEAFTYYLLHGFYPWPGSKITEDFMSLFSKIVQEYPNEFRDFLARYGHYTSLRRRLVFQLDDGGLGQLVELVNRVESSFIIGYVNLLMSEEAQRNIGTGRERDHRNACWEVILAYLLVRRGGFFNRKEFVGQTIGGLAAHYNIGYLELLRFLTVTADGFLRDSNYYSELQKILLELAIEVPEAGGVEEREYSEWMERMKACLRLNAIPDDFDMARFAGLLSLESFRRAMLAALTFQQLARLSELVSAVEVSGCLGVEVALLELFEVSVQTSVARQAAFIGNETKERVTPALYLAEIRKQLRQPHSRRMLISRLDEPAIHSLVKLLVPAESEFIIAYAQSLDEQNEKNIYEGKTGGEFRQLKWEFIFSVLMEDADMSFNRKSFMFSVITMLASHYNLKTADLLSYIYKALLDKRLEVNAGLRAVFEELYFEAKAEKSRMQEVNLFDKALRETFYATQLTTFIQTGTLDNKSYADKLFDILVYLESYRPDLLLSVVEALKGGFVLTDSVTIPHHKAFYRKLIQFAIEIFQINLPGGRQIKSLFSNMDDDRYRGVSVATFKTLLLALLRNDISLYEKAWDVLTERVSPVRLLSDDSLTVVSDKVLLKVIATSDSGAIANLMASEPRLLVERVLSSFDLLVALVDCYSINPSIAPVLEKALRGVSPAFLLARLRRLFPSEGETLSVFFRLLSITSLTDSATGYGTLVFEMLVLLVHDKEHLPEIISRLLLNVGQDGGQKQVETFWMKAGIILPVGSSVRQRIEKLISAVRKTKPGEEAESATPSSGDELETWMTRYFGADGSPVVDGDAAFHAVLFAAFEKQLTEHPDSARQWVEQGKLSKPKITAWLKAAPLSLQLAWLKAVSLPYQRVVIDDAFVLIGWLQAALEALPGVAFPWTKITALLLSFSSGSLQYIDRTELFFRLVTLCVENIEQEERTAILSALQTKAANHGQLWGKRIQILLAKMEPKEEPVARVASESLPPEEPVVPDEEPEVLEEIYISNAGLVLCSPFLPTLFNRLGLLQDGVFPDRQSNERAVLLLQYLLYQTTLFPEHQMVLNKLLCGLVTGTPVDCRIEVTDEEKQTLEQMLTGMIQHWGRLGHTSATGLIESFLCREGKLVQKDETWQLTVEQKSYDMLLDSLPWSYTPIKHRWMKKALTVKWR